MKKAILFIAAIALALNFCLAQAGQLDPSFGIGGKVVVSNLVGDAHAVAVQQDGKIVIAGDKNRMTGDADFLLIRLNTNGTLDNTFDNDGIVTNVLISGDVYATSIVLQGDGKILVGATQEGGYRIPYLLRYNTDGSIDSTFSNDGIVQVPGLLTSYLGRFSLQADGKIVAGAHTLDIGGFSDFAVTRFNPNGGIDSTFAIDGTAIIDIKEHDQGQSNICIQSDHKIVMGASAVDTASLAVFFVLVRYNNDGSLDTTFGNSGRVVTDMRPHAAPQRVTSIQADGKIVVLGSYGTGGQSYHVFARHNPNGSLDNTFGTNGILIDSFFNYIASSTDMILQSYGRILIGGSSAYPGLDFSLGRYNQDGNRDNTFGTGGIVTTDFGTSITSSIQALAEQPDGKTIAVGYTFIIGNLTSQHIAVARYFSGLSPVCINTLANSAYCAGDQMVLTFTNCNETFSAGNVFTVELSNDSGSFANPLVIGSASGTAAVPILCNIPFSTVPSTGYKLRIVTTNPITTSYYEGPLEIEQNNSGFSYVINGMVVNYTMTSILCLSGGFNWDYGNGNTSNLVQNPIVTYATPGTYTVCLQCNGASQCHSCTNITVPENTTGVGAPDASEIPLRIFPNPAREKLNVEITSGSPADAKINLLNILGKQVHSGNIKINAGIHLYEIPILEIPAGLYIVAIHIGDKFLVSKVLVGN